MEFTEADRQTVLNLLKLGQRDAAIQYIAKTYRSSLYDSKKLLEAFELQFAHDIHSSSPPKKFDAATCSGCLSRILKLISILTAIVGISIVALGYFFIELFGDNWNNRRVPAIVTGMVYSRPDSSYINLIYEYRGSEIKSDTGTTEYEISNFQAGDTIQVQARDLELGFDDEAIKAMQERKRMFFLFGEGILFLAFIFWVTNVVFKVRPPSKQVSRYSK